MRILALTLLLLAAGCAPYHNPDLDPSSDQSEIFKKDRTECLNRAQKAAHSAPGNDLRFLKTYDQQQQEYTREVKAYDRCMSSHGWIKN